MTSSDTPDIEDLLFYRQLVNDYSDLYSKAHEKCSMMIIPQTLPDSSKLSRDVFEAHLFAPSPLYKGKHASFNDQYEIELENHRTIRVTQKKRGAGERSIKILGQEDVHSSQSRRSYTILIIDQPLVDPTRLRSSLNGQLTRVPSNSIPLSSQRFSPSTATYESAFVYLDSLRLIEQPFQRLREHLFLFNEKYTILPNYIEKAFDKLRDYRNEFLRESYQIFNKSTEDRDIELASEIYVTGNTYTKFWPVILQLSKHNDQRLFDHVRRRQIKQQKSSPEVTVTINQDASNELRKLDDLKTAFEKAKCVRFALDSVLANKTIAILDRERSSVKYRPGADAMVMAADETLTAFIDFVCQYLLSAKNPNAIHLVAHEYYTEKFRCLPLPQDIDYAFTTFRGAIEYLSSDACFT